MTGFEELTAELNKVEKSVVPTVADILRASVGKAKARTGSQIAEAIYTRTGIRLDGVRLRKVINHIRLTGTVELVAANSSGYYVAEGHGEATEYQKSLRDRLTAIHATLDAFTSQCAKLGIYQHDLFDSRR